MNLAAPRHMNPRRLNRAATAISLARMEWRESRNSVDPAYARRFAKRTARRAARRFGAADIGERIADCPLFLAK
jgi:hypothetical protein